MPSSSVPDWFMRGMPSESVASMWKWQSTKGGETSRPVASIDAAGFGGDARLDRGDLPAGAGDVDAGAAVGEGGVADDQVEGHGYL